MEQYDFKIEDALGNTLYFKFIRGGKGGVKVCCPYKSKRIDNWSVRNPYRNAEKPTGEVVIPLRVEYNGSSFVVKEIDKFAFYNCDGIVKVVLPETITKIGESAFERCWRMERIQIFNEVTEIEERAFCGCRYLKDLFLPESLQKIGCKAFGGCKSLEVINLPNLLMNIGASLFSGCVSLKQVNMPLLLKRIDWGAFNDCIGLKEFEIPASVSYIEHGAFLGCNFKVSSLSEEYVVKDNCLLRVRDDRYDLVYVPCDVEEYEIPEGVTWIGDSIFDFCNRLKRIKLADSVNTIGRYAFALCSSLSEVVVSDNSRLRVIESGAFSHCSELIKITLPKSLVYIGDNAFVKSNFTIINESSNFVAKDNALYTADYKRLIYVCSGTSKFRVDDRVEKIDSCAFCMCRNLKILILPASMGEVPDLKFGVEYSIVYIYTLSPTLEIPDTGKLDKKNAMVIRIDECMAEKLMNIN